MGPKDHWEGIYSHKASESVSWYQERADLSLGLIGQTGLRYDAAILDVGGGASTLVDDLLEQGYTNLTVLDLSGASLQAARRRVGDAPVKWTCADITRASLAQDAYDLWHDRAVFHFLIGALERAAYKERLKCSLRLGGFFIIATFAEDGPTHCSGLPVRRYSIGDLQAEFGEHFHLQGQERESHVTPTGTVQHFNYCLLRKREVG